jgi:hypothetical protein
MSSRTTFVAWLTLVAGVALAIILWQQAFGTIAETKVTYGHARLRYESTERTAKPALAATAVSVGIIGATIWGAWVRRWGALSRALVIGTGLVALVVAVPVTYVRADRVGELSFPDAQRYQSVGVVATRMLRTGIPCADVRPLERTDSRYLAKKAECPIRAELAIDDGFDDATIAIWSDDDARESRRRRMNSSALIAVIGPTWLVVCEFESTCAEIQYKIGGLTF